MGAVDGMSLFEILRGEAPAGLAAEMIEPLFDLAAAHGLITHVNEALQARGLSFPRWQEAADSLELNTRVQLQAAGEVCGALRRQGVQCLLFKGGALALTVYARAGVRTFTDLDILILPEALRPAHQVLTELGFTFRESTLGNPTEVSYVREKLPGFPTEIDLHWAYPGDDSMQAPLRVPVAELFGRATVVQECPVPCLEDCLLLAAVNLYRKSAEPLMLVVDFARLAEKALKWEEIPDQARRWHVRTALWLALDLATTLLKANVPPAVMAQLQPPRWQARRLRAELSGPRLWRSDKQREWHYRVCFKALCLDSCCDRLRVAAALPRGICRKLRLTHIPSDDLVAKKGK
jgi:hypothetical protein